MLGALALAGFQYSYKAKDNYLQNSVFTFLRFVSLFSVLLLLINPKIKKVDYYAEKARLIIAVDNSTSIDFFEKAGDVREFVNKLHNDPDLAERFDVQLFGFGEEVTKNPDLQFREKHTNISRVFKDLKNLNEASRAPTVLISDGNQTLGDNFLFSGAAYPQPIYPVIVGDTSDLQDLAISQVINNKYAFLNNKFPVEIMLSYFGKKNVDSRLIINKEGRQVYSQKLSFNEENNAAVIRTELPTTSIGVQKYTVEIQPFSGEENKENNNDQFAIEVVDERTRILMLYEKEHPDLGAIKKSIESNEQREVLLQKLGEKQVNLDDYQLVILFQPTSQFSTILQEIQDQEKNIWVITGPETDWRFFNEWQGIVRQEITGQPEQYQPVYNSSFDLFQTEDIGFSEFPPLEGNFGEMHLKEDASVLLYKRLQGVDTQDPLWFISTKERTKTAFLLGEGIWQWRSYSYRDKGTFEPFDTYMSKLVQFLSSGKRRDRLVISYDPFYRNNEELIIQAEYFDPNYIFDSNAEILFTIKNDSTGETRTIPFLLRNTKYVVDPGNLSPGDYSFTASVTGAGLARSGSFNLSSFEVEEQFSRANLEIMRSLAEEKEQRVYNLKEFQQLKNYLLETKSFLPLQKSRQNTVPLIEWFYLLGIIILSLALEWFLRKYYGYI